MPLIRQKYTKLDPATGQRVTHESKKYYCLYKRGKKWLRVPAYTDLAASNQKLARLERNAAREAEGMTLTETDEHSIRPIAEHVADFKQHLADRGNTPHHVRTTANRLGYIIENSGAKLIGDLVPSRVDRALAQLVASTKDKKGRSLSSRNHYLRAAKMFTAWAAGAERRLPHDPLIDMGFKNTEKDRRLVRRPLTQDEFSWLLVAAAEGPEVNGMDGATRSMLYLVGAYTGYRRSELGSITARSFDFGSGVGDAAEPTYLHAGPKQPTLTVEAGTSKRRRKEVIPLHSSFVGMLREFVEGGLEDDAEASGGHADIEDGGGPLFQLAGTRTAEMLRTDLARARVLWLDEAPTPADRKRREKSDFLAAVDSDGQVVDFHALRGTFITRLSESGVMPRVAQTLARHSDISLTMNTYTKMAQSNEREAIEMLPAIDQKTHGKLTQSLTQNEVARGRIESVRDGQGRRSRGASSGAKKRKKPR